MMNVMIMVFTVFLGARADLLPLNIVSPKRSAQKLLPPDLRGSAEVQLSLVA
jgi:hypothetical protein